jgi:hypothetical protein
VEVLVREFKNPYYDGPDCVCCHHIKENVVQEIIKMLEEQDSVCSDWVIGLIEKDVEE